MFGDLGNKVEDQDDNHNQWADDSPCCLPENIRLVAYHEFNVLVKPVGNEKGNAKLHVMIISTFTTYPTLYAYCNVFNTRFYDLPSNVFTTAVSSQIETQLFYTFLPCYVTINTL